MLTDFINADSRVGEPLTVDVLMANMRSIHRLIGPQRPNTMLIRRSTYKTIKRWERERVMKYETGVPVLGKRFRFRGDRWKVINR